jgi:hypothetical protein
MRTRLRLDTFALGVVLLVCANACGQAAPPIAAQTQTTPPTVASAPSPVPKASVAVSPAASPVAAVSRSALLTAANASAVALPSPSLASALALPSPSLASARASAVASPSASPSAAIAAPRPAGVSLMFMAPTNGETVNAGSVTVTVSYTGPALVAAANATKLGDYHLHYFLDVDPTPYLGTTLPIPLGDPRIVHSAATSVTFDNVAPASHTLAVVMTGSNHISLNPPVADKVTFTAR